MVVHRLQLHDHRLEQDRYPTNTTLCSLQPCLPNSESTSVILATQRAHIRSSLRLSIHRQHEFLRRGLAYTTLLVVRMINPLPTCDSRDVPDWCSAARVKRISEDRMMGSCILDWWHFQGDFLFGIFRHGYNNDRLCSSEAEAFSEISRLKDHQILVTYNLGKGCRLFTDIRLKPNYATVGIVWLPAIERQMHQNNISYRSTVTSFTLIMQFKLAFISAALATLVVATPSTRDDELASSCTTGLLECCNNVLSASSPEATSILGLLGISGQGLTGLVGFDCSLITAGSSCSAPSQAVCCDNNFNRLVAINCVPPSA